MLRIGCPSDTYCRKDHHNPIAFPEMSFLKNRNWLRRRESCTILWWTGDRSGMPRRSARCLRCGIRRLVVFSAGTDRGGISLLGVRTIHGIMVMR